MTLTLTRNQVPDPPAELARYYGGDPPYPNGGYVIDDECQRWRYDDAGLKLYLEYPSDRPRRMPGTFVAFWEREDYGRPHKTTER